MSLSAALDIKDWLNAQTFDATQPWAGMVGWRVPAHRRGALDVEIAARGGVYGGTSDAGWRQVDFPDRSSILVREEGNPVGGGLGDTFVAIGRLFWPRAFRGWGDDNNGTLTETIGSAWPTTSDGGQTDMNGLQQPYPGTYPAVPTNGGAMDKNIGMAALIAGALGSLAITGVTIMVGVSLSYYLFKRAGKR